MKILYLIEILPRVSNWLVKEKLISYTPKLITVTLLVGNGVAVIPEVGPAVVNCM
jgi:hypothetical protein